MKIKGSFKIKGNIERLSKNKYLVMSHIYNKN